MGPGPFLFPIWKPAHDKVQEILNALRDDSFNYDPDLVGATRDGVEHVQPLKQQRYKIDHNRVCLGSGEATFRRAREAVKGWKHFQLDWAVVNPQTLIQERGRVAVVARSFNLVWTLNPLQIVYLEDSLDPKTTQSVPRVPLKGTKSSKEKPVGGRKAGAKVTPEEGASGTGPGKGRFAYGNGTLNGHLLAGEERFLVEWKDDDSVWYDILAFSKPGHILAAATYPVARFYQRKFGKQSLRAVKDAVHAGPSDLKSDGQCTDPRHHRRR